MTGLVKGIRRTSGEFDATPYDNTYIHCVVPPDNNTLAGKLVEVFKMRSMTFNAICDDLKIGISDLVGKNIRVFYDKYGRVEDFEILKT